MPARAVLPPSERDTQPGAAGRCLVPVFLHSGFRTGSTYVWSKFRELTEVVAYIEPLHEALATLTPGNIDEAVWNSWNSHHPALEEPYFAEYWPLLRREGGVRGYELRLAFGDTFSAAQPVELYEYIKGLLTHTAADQVACLGFCRSTSRTTWMCQAFPQALHVLLIRDPVDQWLSARAIFERDGNPYFMAAPFMDLAGSVPDSAGSRLARSLGITESELDYHERMRAAKTFLSERSATENWSVFLHYWLLTTAVSVYDVDLCIDINKLSLDGGYRRDIEGAIATQSGLSVNFADASIATYPAPRDLGLARITEHALRTVEDILEQSDHPAARDLADLGSRLRRR